MNRKEWKEFCKVDRAKGYYWYNKVTKKRLSKEFESLENCDLDAKVIHHLRDTEEQRKYNDEHYEMFGFELDENGNEVFNYGRYVVFWTKEHHNEYHKCSEETRKKRSESLKGIPRTDEWKLKLSESGKGKHNFTEEQRLQISKSVKEYYEQDGSREKTSIATREAMRRPEVRQHLIDSYKKKPPRSKESRQKSAEANRGKKLSEETKKKLSEQKKLYYNALRYNKFESCYKTDDLLMLHIHSIIGNINDEDVVNFISCSRTIIQPNKHYSTSDMASLFHTYKQHSKISWNTFQCVFNELRTAITLMEIYGHK